MKTGLYIFPGDWTASPAAACSLAAQGLWFRLLLIMASNEHHYGTLRRPDGSPMDDGVLARRCGCSTSQFRLLMAELDDVGAVDRVEGAVACNWLIERQRQLAAKAHRQRRYAERQQGRLPDAPDGAPDDAPPFELHGAQSAAAANPIHSEPAAAAAGRTRPGQEPPASGGDQAVRQRLAELGVTEPTLSELAASGVTAADVEACRSAGQRGGKGVGVLVLELRRIAGVRHQAAAAKARRLRTKDAMRALEPARQDLVYRQAVTELGWAHVPPEQALKADKVWDKLAQLLGVE